MYSVFVNDKICGANILIDDGTPYNPNDEPAVLHFQGKKDNW
ncbi:MAG: hypothetical protein ACRCXT_17690 [Paraclostridium sp.]